MFFQISGNGQQPQQMRIVQTVNPSALSATPVTTCATGQQGATLLTGNLENLIHNTIIISYQVYLGKL